jgi:hypothetical protein
MPILTLKCTISSSSSSTDAATFGQMSIRPMTNDQSEKEFTVGAYCFRGKRI